MVINISDVWENACTQHYDYLNSLIDRGIGSLGNSFLDVVIKDFIQTNRSVIVEGAPSDLAGCILDYEKKFGRDILHFCVLQKLTKIFDYASFSAKSDKSWTAYELCELAKYNICCYCHMVSTETSLPDKHSKGYRPPIDHYYTKSDYPFLALTLSNFIPCCEKCNGSQMKHSIDFAKVPHLNPLVDIESIEFELRPAEVDEELVALALSLQLRPENYLLSVDAKHNLSLSNMSISTFQLKNRYKHYASQAFYLARKIKSFVARKSTYASELEFNIELADLLEFEPEEYKNIQYGKARLCIAKQYGAIVD